MNSPSASESVESYNVAILQPQGYVHSMALLEVARLLQLSFHSLGFSCSLRINDLERSAINVILGYHLVPDASRIPAYRRIYYQLEQLSDREGWYGEAQQEVLAGAEQVWDYCPENAEFLRDRGIGKVHVLPIGFHEGLETVRAAPEQDVDVLFYGSINDRRSKILDALERKCRVRRVFGAYGEDRDRLIARSRVVLNVHYYAAQVMEQVRISYLLNNRRFVLSESAPRNPYEALVETAPYEDLVERCLYFLERPTERTRLAALGYRSFSRQPMVSYLSEVLRTSGLPLASRRSLG